jgi:hypothetical protein
MATMRTGLLLAFIPVVLTTVAMADPVGAPCPELTPANQWKAGYRARLDTGLEPVSRKARALFALGQQGLALRRDDGGALSPLHRAALQARLNAIQSGRY